MVDYAEPYYRVHLTVGPYAWVVERGDPADYGPTDGLKIGWKYPEAAAWPTQHEIPYASFGVIVADAADFAGVDIGSPVAISVYHVPAGTIVPAGYAQAGTTDWIPVASFSGRVTDLGVKPSRLGMIYQVSCLDYLVDLAEARLAATGPDAWPGESIEDRLTRIADDLPDVFGGAPWDMYSGPEPDWGIFHANDADDLKPALDWVTEHLSQYVQYGHYDPPIQGGARGIIATNNTGVYGTADDPDAMLPQARRFELTWIFRRLFNRGQAAWLPARFRPTGAGGTWRPDVDADDDQAFYDDLYEVPELDGSTIPAALGVIPADVIQYDADWSRTKKGRAERVYVQTSVVYVDAPNAKRAGRGIEGIYGYDYSSTPPPTLTVDSTLGYRSEAFHLADFLLREPGHADRWEVEKFRLLADLIPDRIIRANSTSWFHPILFANYPLRAIAGLPVEQNPNGGADWYAGILTGAEFNLTRGRYAIDFTLSRELPRPATSTTGEGGYLSFATLAADPVQATVTLADLDPAYSIYDYRAARRG